MVRLVLTVFASTAVGAWYNTRCRYMLALYTGYRVAPKYNEMGLMALPSLRKSGGGLYRKEHSNSDRISTCSTAIWPVLRAWAQSTTYDLHALEKNPSGFSHVPGPPKSRLTVPRYQGYACTQQCKRSLLSKHSPRDTWTHAVITRHGVRS